MFKVTKDISDDKSVVFNSLIEELNRVTDKLKELDILFWCKVIQQWTGLELNEFSIYSRDSWKNEEYEKEKSLFGIKNAKDRILEKTKDKQDEIKMDKKIRAKKSEIQQELDFYSRVTKRVNAFKDVREMLIYLLRVDSNKYTVAIASEISRQYEKALIDMSVEEITIIRWIMGTKTLGDMFKTIRGSTYIFGLGKLAQLMIDNVCK